MKFKQFARSIIESGVKESYTYIQKTRIRFHNIILIIALFIALNFIIFDFIINKQVHLPFFLIFLGLFSVYIFNHYLPLYVIFGNFIVGFLILVYFTYSGGIENTGLIWYLISPPVYFFLTSSSIAISISILVFFLLPATIIFQSLGLITVPFSNTVLAQASIAYVLVSAISYIYAKVNGNYQKQLEKNIEELKTIDKLKDEFISLASHQLRTPLTAMKWFLEMMVRGEMGEVSPPQKSGLENIYKSNERMIALVNALLNVSRLDTGRVAVRPKSTNLRSIVDSVLPDLQTMIDKKHLKFTINELPGLPEINVDPQLIRVVYSNLLSNAIRYTPDVGQITISLYPKENTIISEIKDSGYGIPKDEQERVFQKFFRASNIVRIDTEGTGLGLYLTRAIIESSGGTIWFESEEGRGTTFYFSLPITGSLAHEGAVGIENHA